MTAEQKACCKCQSWQAHHVSGVAAHLCMVVPLAKLVDAQLDGSVYSGAFALSLTESVLVQYFMQRDSLGLGHCHTSCLRRQAARLCCHQSYNSCKSLLHKSLPCLNSQGTKSDLLFVQSYPIFSIPQATVFMRHEHSNRHHHKTKKVQNRHSCMAELHHCTQPSHAQSSP